jgi:HEAT repeat protein
MRVLLPALLLIVICGCRHAAPTQAGGKPVSYWVETLHSSPDARLRKEAAFKLGNVGPADPSSFPALCEALKDRESAVRCEAILALLKFGPVAQEAIPSLTELRENDRDPKVRDYAAKALEKLARK